MASYSYTRDLKEDDLAPPEVHVYTKKELWENWWDYNLKWVIAGIIGLGLLIYFICDAYIFKTEYDYQIALISPQTIYESTQNDIVNSLTPQLDDLTGDGEVNVQICAYQVDMSGYAPASGEAAASATPAPTATVSAEDTALAADSFGTDGTYDYYLTMAGQVQLSADLELAESVIFILYDPASFQNASAMLCYPDGTLPEDPDNTPWEELVYAISDCDGLSEDVRETLDGYFIGRRGGSADDAEYAARFDSYQPMWELIIGDAAPYSERVA